MSDEIKIPTEYEEAVKRKKELMEKINAYSEAELLGNPLPYTEEEVDEFQKEYEMLEDALDLTDEEKLQKLDDKDVIVKEDGTRVRKHHAIDDVNVLLFILPIVLLFTSFLPLFISSKVGEKVYSYFERFYQVAYEHNIGENLFSHSPYMWDNTVIIGAIFRACWINLLVLGVTILIYLAFLFWKKTKPINKKIMLVILIVVAVATITCGIIGTVNAINNFGKPYMENPDIYYNIYKSNMDLQKQFGL